VASLKQREAALARREEFAQQQAQVWPQGARTRNHAQT
jgi:hypothetical protein